MIKGFEIPKVIFRVREGDTSNDEEICAIGGRWTDNLRMITLKVKE